MFIVMHCFRFANNIFFRKFNIAIIPQNRVYSFANFRLLFLGLFLLIGTTSYPNFVRRYKNFLECPPTTDFFVKSPKVESIYIRCNIFCLFTQRLNFYYFSGDSRYYCIIGNVFIDNSTCCYSHIITYFYRPKYCNTC